MDLLFQRKSQKSGDKNRGRITNAKCIFVTRPQKSLSLILDSNKDGYISTIALEDSNAYFDITVDGIDEVFGNLTTSGFEELKEIAA